MTWQLLIRAVISAIMIVAIAQVSKRFPGFGGLIASLPLVSVLGMIWLWRDRPDPALLAAHSTATFWYVIPSLPMFLAIPALLRAGWSFWAALGAGCLLTVLLYTATVAIGTRLGLPL